MEVTTDDVHDSEALPALINDASKLRRVSEAVMDGAYDNAGAYKLLRRISVKPIIKPRRNARSDRGPPERRGAVRLIRRLGDGWLVMVDAGLLKQHSQHSNASTENTAWLKTWRA